MRLRVGLIGLGRAWENRHRPALCALADRFEVRAVCEQVALRATMRLMNSVPSRSTGSAPWRNAPTWTRS